MLNLVVSLKPSRYRWFFLIALTALCLLAILLASIAWWLQVLLMFGLVALIVQSCQSRVTGVVKQADSWRVVDQQGELVPVKLSDYYAAPWLMILSFRQPGVSRLVRVVIWPDSLPNQQFKYMRVALREAIL